MCASVVFCRHCDSDSLQISIKINFTEQKGLINVQGNTCSIVSRWTLSYIRKNNLNQFYLTVAGTPAQRLSEIWGSYWLHRSLNSSKFALRPWTLHCRISTITLRWKKSFQTRMKAETSETPPPPCQYRPPTIQNLISVSDISESSKHLGPYVWAADISLYRVYLLSTV